MSVDRFDTLLYGTGEAAGHLSIPPSTLSTWAYGYGRPRTATRGVTAKPIITAIRPDHSGDAAMPFIGLAEAYALAAFRNAGVPMQRIRPAVDREGILAFAAGPGPYIYSVQLDRLSRLYPPP